ncbi:MAG: Trk system potassium transporter TrkA [Pseudomonadota bacterium]
MKIIICGAGQVGEQIARRLSDEGHTVTVIDRDARLVRAVTDKIDVGGIVGHASHPDIQERAGAVDADMIIAVTHLDEVNMVACQVAHTEFNVPQKIARIRAGSYLQTRWSDLFRRDHMPIDVIISPETEVANVALSRLRRPSAFDMAHFLGDEVSVAGMVLDEDCAVVNTPLRQLTELFSTLEAFVLGIRRDGEIFAASSDEQLLVNDQVYVLSTKKDLDRTISIFGGDRPPARNIVVIGGGMVGLTVAQSLEESVSDARVRMIERNRDVAERAADTLESTVVLHGDGLSPELLEEAGVASADAAIVLTDDDRVNLLASALCKTAGAAQTIALTNDPVFSTLAGTIGVDTVINPRSATASTILRHVRRGRVRAIHSIGEGEAEVIEAQVLSTSSIAGKRLRDANFPKGAVVGAVLRRDKVELPKGDTLISEDDRVVIFAEAAAVAKVEAMFRVSVDFF